MLKMLHRPIRALLICLMFTAAGHAAAQAALAMDAVQITITLANGSREEMRIAHCVGSREQPMTDAQLDDKFRAQCDAVLGNRRSIAALALLRCSDTLEHVDDCAWACAKEGES